MEQTFAARKAEEETSAKVEALKKSVSNMALILFFVAIINMYVDQYFVGRVLHEFGYPYKVSLDVSSLVANAAVPVLGYIGARGRVRSALCCFACFNCCSCFFYMILFCLLCVLLAGSSAMTNGLTEISTQLQHCDPATLCPLTAGEHGLVADQQSADCLIASVWSVNTTSEDNVYHRQFDGSTIPSSCPSLLFLHCSSVPDLTDVLTQSQSTNPNPTVQLTTSMRALDALIKQPLPPKPELQDCMVNADLVESYHLAATNLPHVMDGLSTPLNFLWFMDVVRLIAFCFAIRWGCQLRSAIKHQDRAAKESAEVRGYVELK